MTARPKSVRSLETTSLDTVRGGVFGTSGHVLDLIKYGPPRPQPPKPEKK
jgi:hypothetical protein